VAGAQPLPRSFFARPAPVVARDLLGRILIGSLGGPRVAGRLVECEAYQQDDPASHSFRGPTARTAVMFGPAGHLYVYFTYGMHFCMNVVTGQEDEGSAVLLRAVEPLEGLEAMRARRRVTDDRLLCSGPARLTRAYGVDRTSDGLDLTIGRALWIARGSGVPDEQVGSGPRVGIRVAVENPWRYVEAGNRFVSRGPRPKPRISRPTAAAAASESSPEEPRERPPRR
jgi:DNA-3-methyladenine glycosylase